MHTSANGVLIPPSILFQGGMLLLFMVFIKDIPSKTDGLIFSKKKTDFFHFPCNSQTL